MAWTWRYEDPEGQEVRPGTDAPEPENFPNQSDAETWIGLNWRELFEHGVLQVSLMNGDDVTYTMALTPAEPN